MMKANKYIRALLAGWMISHGAFAQRLTKAPVLAYDSYSLGPVPVPASERLLQTVTAEPFFKVSSENHVLEGAVFDKRGNLLFCDVTNRSVMRLTRTKQLSTVLSLDSLSPGGLAFHKDGRLFVAALNLTTQKGAIFSVSADGTDLRAIVDTKSGYMPNDLVFDPSGGLYFTDFKGSAFAPVGGVFYMPADFSTVKPFLPGLAMANGIALSPDGTQLWVSEFGKNLLHRITLAGPATIAPIGTAVVYHFIGPAPDSMRSDSDGNVYVALYGQGRIMAFNRNGIPIGQVLLPGRELGHHLQSTSLAIRPGSRDLYSVTADGENGRGASIFWAKAFAKGL